MNPECTTNSCPTTSCATATKDSGPKHCCTSNTSTSYPKPFTAGNMQSLQGTVRYIRVPAGTTKATYNLRPATLNNVTTVNTPAIVTTTPVSTGRG